MCGIAMEELHMEVRSGLERDKEWNPVGMENEGQEVRASRAARSKQQDRRTERL